MTGFGLLVPGSVAHRLGLSIKMVLIKKGDHPLHKLRIGTEADRLYVILLRGDTFPLTGNLYATNLGSKFLKP